MNTCASCHVAGHGTAFRLLRATEGGVVNRRATQQNLAAVLGQINKAHWEASPFLAKALSVHGEATQPPMKSRQSPAYKNLEEWVRQLMANNPQLQEHPAAPIAVAPTEVKPPAATPEATKSDFAAEPGLPTPRPTAPSESAPVKPSDPFDPAAFNQATPLKEKKEP
jgi:hypothetical protein